MYIAAFQHGVIAVSLSTGRAEWTKDISSYAGVAADSDNLYLSDDKGRVWALDRMSGRAVWKQDKLQARAVTAPAVVDDYVVVGDLEGYLHWLNKEDGQFVARVRVDSSALIASPFTVDDTLFAYSSAGTLSAFKPQGKLAAPAEEATAEDETSDKESAERETATTGQDKDDAESKPDGSATDKGGAEESAKSASDASSDDKSSTTTGDGSETPAKSETSTTESAQPADSGDAATAKSESGPTPTEPPKRRGPRPSMRSPDWLYP
jgi:hypothetical protein